MRWMNFATRRPGLWRSCELAIAVALGASVLPAQEATLTVRVFDERTGETARGLSADRFSVKDGDTALRVVAISEPDTPVAVLLVVDSSMVGEVARPLAEAMIDVLGEGEVMGLVSFDDTADLLQDSTADKHSLHNALNRIEYGNLPRLHDAVFASIDSGFDLGFDRKAIVLLSAGVIARSRTTEAEAVELARAKGVSIFPVFMRNEARGALRRLALRTGGASFAAKRLNLEPRQLARRILEAVRSPYELSVTGVYTLGNQVTAAVSSDGPAKTKLTVSVLPID